MNRQTEAAPIRAILRQHRALHGIEQDRMAKEIGIGASTLCRFEKGKDMDSEATLKLINWLFGVSP